MDVREGLRSKSCKASINTKSESRQAYFFSFVPHPTHPRCRLEGSFPKSNPRLGETKGVEIVFLLCLWLFWLDSVKMQDSRSVAAVRNRASEPRRPASPVSSDDGQLPNSNLPAQNTHALCGHSRYFVFTCTSSNLSRTYLKSFFCLVCLLCGIRKLLSALHRECGLQKITFVKSCPWFCILNSSTTVWMRSVFYDNSLEGEGASSTIIIITKFSFYCLLPNRTIWI